MSWCIEAPASPNNAGWLAADVGLPRMPQERRGGLKHSRRIAGSGDHARVAEAWFDGRGRLVSQAAASILCETVEGRRLADLCQLTAPDFLTTLGTPLIPARRGRALLAWQALHAILGSIPADASTAAAA